MSLLRWVNQASTRTFLLRILRRRRTESEVCGEHGPMNVRAGLVQLQVRTNRTEDNLGRAAEYVRTAAARGCQLVVLPEAFSTGLNLPKSRQCAVKIPGPGLEWLSTLAAELKVHLVAGILEEDNGAVYSSIV